jgi:predicted transposase YdaD
VNELFGLLAYVALVVLFVRRSQQLDRPRRVALHRSRAPLTHMTLTYRDGSSRYEYDAVPGRVAP